VWGAPGFLWEDWGQVATGRAEAAQQARSAGATAGSQLASSYLVDTVRRHFAKPGRAGGMGPAPRVWLGRGALLSVVWVDDTVWDVKGPRHRLCGGLEAGCVECGLLQVEAVAAMDRMEAHCLEVHMWLSDDKRQVPGQRVVYTGIIVDNIRGRFFCPEEKRAAVVSAVRELGKSTRSLGCRLGRWRGCGARYFITHAASPTSECSSYGSRRSSRRRRR